MPLTLSKQTAIMLNVVRLNQESYKTPTPA